MIKKYGLIILFSLLLIADLTYTFIQQYHIVLDGDLAAIVGPKDLYCDVLTDPLGLQVLFENKIYCAPNRYFAHATLLEYYSHVPFWFHGIADPVESLYLATAVGKVLIQVFLVVLLALYITVGRLTLQNFLFAAILVIPFFQMFGYYLTMGIVDLSPSYAFFYALPIALLMVFFFPFYKSLYKGEQLNLSWVSIIFLVLLSVVVCLNGPLIPAVSCVACPIVLLVLWYKSFRAQAADSFVNRSLSAFGAMPKNILFLFTWMIVLSLYSLYIGLNNAENLWGEVLPLVERYKRLPVGFYEIITGELGLPLFLLAIFINAGIIYSQKAEYRTKILTTLKWIGIFSFIYLLLLPFGGYRSYRPNIIRYDTFIPVTLSLVYFFGLSTFYLLTDHSFLNKKVYAGVVVVLLLWFTNAGRSGQLANWFNNNCEKEQLYKIYNSKEEIVEISASCNMINWIKIEKYEDSRMVITFLRRCGIVKGKKYYFQK